LISFCPAGMSEGSEGFGMRERREVCGTFSSSGGTETEMLAMPNLARARSASSCLRLAMMDLAASRLTAASSSLSPELSSSAIIMA